MSITVTISVSAVQSPTPDVDADEMSNSRRSPSLRWICVGDDHPCWRSPTDFFVAYHWLVRSSSPFSVTLPVFSRADHRTSQVLTTSHVVFISTFCWRLASKALQFIRPLLIRPRPWRHTPRLIVMHVVFRFLLNIFEYATKQACMQLQCNKAKLSEPASINWSSLT